MLKCLQSLCVKIRMAYVELILSWFFGVKYRDHSKLFQCLGKNTKIKEGLFVAL